MVSDMVSFRVEGRRQLRLCSFRLLLVVLCQLSKPSAHPVSSPAVADRNVHDVRMGHQKSASTLAAYETRLVHMRGGGRREARELTVPSSECPTLDIGIESVCKIDTLFIRKGRTPPALCVFAMRCPSLTQARIVGVQRWKDLRKVGQRTLNIAG